MMVFFCPEFIKNILGPQGFHTDRGAGLTDRSILYLKCSLLNIVFANAKLFFYLVLFLLILLFFLQGNNYIKMHFNT